MKYSTILISIGIGLAVAQGAWADTTFSGALGGGYTWQTVKDVNINLYDGSGSVLATFGNSGFNAQLGGGYANQEIEGHSFGTWSFNGLVFWRDIKGAIGVNASYNSMDISGTNFGYENYGLFGEWYAMNDLTLRIRGGGISGEHDVSGAYGAAGGEYYITPDLGLNVDAGYNNLSGIHWATAYAGAEYLILHEYPLSVSLGYQFVGYTGIPGMHGVMVRLNYRFGLSGSLIELDRSGPITLPSLEFLAL
jgi:hypothetical protein